jgi:hypothetical protein
MIVVLLRLLKIETINMEEGSSRNEIFILM